MKILRYIWLSFLCGLLFCCNNQQKNGSETVININVENCTKYNTSDFIKGVKVIKLETNDSCLIGNISKVQYINNNIYILDIRLNTIFVFNEDGKFLKKLSKQGAGPGEYFQIMDFMVSDKHIYIQDFTKKTIMKYDNDFKYIDKKDYSSISFNFTVLGDDIWIYKVPSDLSNDYTFIRIDKDGKEHYCLKNKDNVKHKYNWSGVNTFYNNGNNVYASPIHENTIYKIYNDSLQSTYKINFVGHNFPENECVNDYDITSPDFPYALKYNFFFTDRYIIFNYCYNRTLGICYYDINKKKANYSTNNDFLGGFPIMLKWSNDNYLIEDVLPSHIDDFSIFLKYNEKVKDIKDDDNPLIVIYTLKN